MSKDKPKNSSSTTFYDEGSEKQISSEVKREFERQLPQDPQPTTFDKYTSVVDRPEPSKSSWIWSLQNGLPVATEQKTTLRLKALHSIASSRQFFRFSDV
jgi:hypothetical protein